MTRRGRLTRRGRREIWQVVVGIVVMLGLSALVYIAFSGTITDDQDGYLVSARFQQVDGLAIGSPVLLAGVKVGEVTAMRLDPARMQPVVTFRIGARIKLPIDSAVYILSDGILGSKYVKVEPGLEDQIMKAGDRFESVQNAIIVENLLERIVKAAEARRAARKARSE